MAALPFMLLMLWLSSHLTEHYDKKVKEYDAILKGLDSKSTPKYRMKEVSPESDELFMTDLGDFDEAFKL